MQNLTLVAVDDVCPCQPLIDRNLSALFLYQWMFFGNYTFLYALQFYDHYMISQVASVFVSELDACRYARLMRSPNPLFTLILLVSEAMLPNVLLLCFAIAICIALLAVFGFVYMVVVAMMLVRAERNRFLELG